MLLFRCHWTHGRLPELFSAHWDCGWFLLFFWGGGLLGSDSFCFGGVVFLDLRPGPHTTHPGLVVLYIFLLVLGLQEPALRGGYCQEPGPDDPGPMGSFGLVGV